MDYELLVPDLAFKVCKNNKEQYVDYDWTFCPLPDIAFFQEGPGLRNWQWTNEGMKVINVTNLVDGKLVLSNTNRYISLQEFNEKYSHFAIENNDILLASSGNSYCKVSIVKKENLPLMMNTSVIRLHILNKDRDSQEYLYHFLSSMSFKNQIDRMITGSAQPNFGPYHLKRTKVPRPSLKEQSKIAAILSTVDASIEATDMIITQTEQVKKGLMNELLIKGVGHSLFKDSEIGCIPEEWPIDDIGKILVDVLDFRGKTPKKLGMDWGNGNIPAISANNVEMGNINLIKEAYYGSEELYKAWMTRGDTARGDIVMTMEAPLGNIAQIPDDRKYILSQRVILLKINPAIAYSDFIKYYLMSDMFQMQLKKNSTGTTALGIQQKQLLKLKLVIPPLNEQQKIASIIISLDNKIEVERQNRKRMDYIKKGLMQVLLTGKIRVKVDS